MNVTEFIELLKPQLAAISGITLCQGEAPNNVGFPYGVYNFGQIDLDYTMEGYASGHDNIMCSFSLYDNDPLFSVITDAFEALRSGIEAMTGFEKNDFKTGSGPAWNKEKNQWEMTADFLFMYRR